MAKALEIDEEYLLDLAQRLVQTDSVNPHHDPRPASEANEEKVADLLTAELDGMGLPHRREYPEPHRPVLIAELGDGCGRALMLNAHMDTVGTQGLDAPFSGEIRGGRLHGRGATDTKGSVAAMVAALQALGDAQLGLKGKCIFTAVCDEEYGGIGTQFIAEHGPCADAAIVGEPTNLGIGVGQVGGVKFKVICKGKAAHGNIPDAGVSAIQKAAALALKLPEAAKRRSHPLLGSPGFNIGRIAGGVDATTVPDYCELDCDRRILPGETAEQIVSDVQDVLDEMRATDRDLDAEIEPPYLGPVYGFELPADEPIVRSICQAHEKMTGEEPTLVVTPYGGDGMYLYGAGIPSITFGPGDVRDAHFGEESVELSQVLSAAEILASTVIDYCGVE